MKTPKTLTALAVLAVVAFPVTIAIVTLDSSRSVFSRSSQPNEEQQGKTDGSTQKSETSNPLSNVSAEVNSQKTAELISAGLSRKTSSPEIVLALRSIVKELSTAHGQAKVEETKIQAALKENQNFRKVTAQKIKATERAIKEIERSDSLRSSLRDPGSVASNFKALNQADLPAGWELYVGKLGRGFGRAYSTSELDNPTGLIRSLDAVTLSASRSGDDSRIAEKATTMRYVYLSGIDKSDKRLVELRKLGEPESIAFKMVRSVLPSFDVPYLMVQVVPRLVSKAGPLSEIVDSRSE